MQTIFNHVFLAALFIVSAALPAAGAAGRNVTAADAAFRFIVLNDIHMTVNDLPGSKAQLRRAVDEINAMVPEVDLVLVAGDLGHADSAADLAIELQAARQELDRLLIPYHVTMGNHDVTLTADDTAFRNTFGSTSYKFTHKGMTFISLKTAITRSSTVIPINGLDSLSSTLSRLQGSDPVMVFGHHPLGPLTPFGASNKHEFYNRINAHNVKAVFSGHYHGVFEEERNGVWYGTSGALSEHRCNHDGKLERGYRLVSVWPDFSISTRFFALGNPPTFEPSIPRLVATGNRYAVPGSMLRLKLTAVSYDGDPIDYAASNLPSGAAFDSVMRVFSWTPTNAQVGFHSDIEFRAHSVTGTDTLRMGVRVLANPCLYEDFDPTQATWSGSGGSWTVQNGEAVQNSAAGGSYFYTAGPSWSDLFLEADVKHEAGIGYAGLVFRYVDANNNYYVWNNSSHIALRRRINGVASQIGPSIPVGAITGWHHLRVEALGSNIKIYWDGTLRVDEVDHTFNGGKVGFVCSKAAARFDNIVASGCGVGENRPPVLQAIGHQKAALRNPMSITLAATDPEGDPLQFSVSNMPSGAQWDAGSRTLTWTPDQANPALWRNTTFRVTDGELDDAETIDFTILDQITSCLFDDFVDPGVLGNWNRPAGSWYIDGGAYVGSSTSAAISTLGSQSFTNYTFEARLRVDGSGYGNVIFRVQDPTHYYYLFTSNRSNETQIRKRHGSSTTTLARAANVCGGVRGNWHVYRVQVQDDLIRLWIDGERRFEIVDTGAGGQPAYMDGSIGLRVKNATLTVDYINVFHCSGTPVDVPQFAGPQLDKVHAYPNPFNPVTTASFELGRPGHTRVSILNANGRLVRQLFDGPLTAGSHQWAWNGRDRRDTAMASGVYYLRVRVGDRTQTRSLVLLK